MWVPLPRGAYWGHQVLSPGVSLHPAALPTLPSAPVWILLTWMTTLLPEVFFSSSLSLTVSFMDISIKDITKVQACGRLPCGPSGTCLCPGAGAAGRLQLLTVSSTTQVICSWFAAARGMCLCALRLIKLAFVRMLPAASRPNECAGASVCEFSTCPQAFWCELHYRRCFPVRTGSRAEGVAGFVSV